MPKVGVTREQLEGLKNPPAGVYEFRLDGFTPKWAKEKEGKDRSINMRPQLSIINHPTLNGEKIMTHGNTAFGVELYDMCHSLGVPYDNEGSDNPTIPGDFDGPDDDPSKWQYKGPLLAQVGKVELADKTGSDNKVRSQVKRYFCRVPNCQAAHRESLL